MPTFRTSLFALLLGLALLSVSGPAAAQQRTSADIERLSELLKTDLYQELVMSQWQRQGMELCGDPPIPGALHHAGLSIVEPLHYSGESLKGGAWIDRYRGRACNRERQFNFLFAVIDGDLQVRHMMPGRTATSIRLQLDAMQKALPMAMRKAEDCKALIPVDSEYQGPLRDNSGGWKELWIFEACGKLVTVTVDFRPDGKGGTFFEMK